MSERVCSTLLITNTGFTDVCLEDGKFLGIYSETDGANAQTINLYDASSGGKVIGALKHLAASQPQQVNMPAAGVSFKQLIAEVTRAAGTGRFIVYYTK